MMQARLSVMDADGGWVAEDALAADLPRAASLLADGPRAEGGLVIEDTDSGARMDVGDTLGPLVAWLCLSGLDRLEAEGRVEVTFQDRRDRLTITRDGDVVRLDGTDAEPQHFPAVPYFEALRACGARYQALMDGIEPLRPATRLDADDADADADAEPADAADWP